MKEFIDEIIWEIPVLTEKRVYKIMCSIKARQKKYWSFGLWKRDWSRFWISDRQMQYFINLMLDYGFISVDGTTRSSRWFPCRVFKASEQLLGYLSQIKDYVFKKFEYIDPIAYVKSMFSVVKKWSKLVFKVSWIKYTINIYWKFKWVIYDTQNNCIVSPLSLW